MMRKLLYIFLFCCMSMFISCEDDGCMHPNKIKRHPEFYGYKVEYVEKYCPTCNGVGQVKLSPGERVLWGVVTFGGGFLFETMECDMCRGTGVIKVRKLNNK